MDLPSDRIVPASASTVLRQLLETLRDRPDFTVRELMTELGGPGLLLLCALMSLPFLFPVSIPGVSTVFGAAILLIALALAAGRLPWLPARLADRQLDARRLRPVLERGLGVLERLDRWLRTQRLGRLTGAAMNRINSLALALAAGLLMMPFGLVPFSNTLPGLAILLLALGMSQRDGLLVLAGYLMMLMTLVYFSLLILAAWKAGSWLMVE